MNAGRHFDRIALQRRSRPGDGWEEERSKGKKGGRPYRGRDGYFWILVGLQVAVQTLWNQPEIEWNILIKKFSHRYIIPYFCIVYIFNLSLLERKRQEKGSKEIKKRRFSISRFAATPSRRQDSVEEEEISSGHDSRNSYKEEPLNRGPGPLQGTGA